MYGIFYRLGLLAYWLGCTIAALLILGAVASFSYMAFDPTSKLGEALFIGIAIIVCGGLVWLVGAAVRFIIVGPFGIEFPIEEVGVLLICVLVLGAFGLGFAVSDHDRPMVHLTVTHDPQACRPKAPMLVSVANRSADPVERISFQIEGRLADSGNLIRHSNGIGGYVSDQLIRSGKSWEECFALPPQIYDDQAYPPERLIWSTTEPRPVFGD